MPLPNPVQEWINQRKLRSKARKWEQSGRQGPIPHLVKQQAIAKYAQLHGTKTLVETGTLHGDMCHAMRDRFDKIITIELNDQFYHEAVERFRNTPHITPLHGDSGVVIKEVLDTLDEPALFWLDGHYSAGNTARADLDTPVSQELEHILAHRVRDHVILIDDARNFIGENGYPELDQLRAHLLEQRPGWSFEVETDCIRFTPPKPDHAR